MGFILLAPVLPRRPKVPAALADESMYEKIKTIGNTYMVAAGIPHTATGDGSISPAVHVQAAIALSCKMQEAVEALSAEKGGSRVRLRVGVHSGAVTAGVIGIEKYCFDIWGDTVNVASRMDSTGIPGKIQLSPVAWKLLSASAEGRHYFEMEPRGQVQVKGKGLMDTFLVSQTLGKLAQAGSVLHDSVSALPSCSGELCPVVETAAQTTTEPTTPTVTIDPPSQTLAPMQVPLQAFSLFFESIASEAAFRTEYNATNLSVANSSAVLAMMFLLSFVFLTACWAWNQDELTGGDFGNGSDAEAKQDDYERQMWLAWLVVIGNTSLAATMALQVQCVARTQRMQRALGSFSVISIAIIFAMNVAADSLGYSQLLETPYMLSGLIFVFFLSKILVVYAARICWTWLLAHTVYRYRATGLHSLFYAEFGSPLFLFAMTMMLHVLASDAERKVRQGHWLRTVANAQSLRLKDARASSDTLLENCLPKSVISAALSSTGGGGDGNTPQMGGGVQHRSFEVYREATVLFVDIVNFTKLSSGMQPYDLVSMLHDLFAQIDQLVERYPVEKIKTIGDAYMVASGLPEWRDDHAEAIAEFALDLLDIVRDFNESNRLAGLNRPHLAVRAGIHTGAVIAGIIGDKKFCYDVWGAGVDGAAEMEQEGVANRVHLSQSTARHLSGLYHMDPREPAPTRNATVTGAPKTLSSGGARSANPSKPEVTYFLTGRSKRVDFTREPAKGGETATSLGDGDALGDDVRHEDGSNVEDDASGARRTHARASVRVHRSRRHSVCAVAGGELL